MTLEKHLREDRVNDNLTLMQYTDGLTFGTDALLLAAYINRGAKSRALELGGGTGIVSLLLATRKKVRHVECVEIQPAFAALAQRNVTLNALDGSVKVTEADIRRLGDYGEGEFDIVLTNPPYMKNEGAACQSEEKQIARHEVCGTVDDFVLAAAKKLKWGGRFFCVWRPDRMEELFAALSKNGIAPKRMTFVHATPDLPPSILLLEGKRGGKPGLRVTPPLLIGGDLSARADSPHMCYILEKGAFPAIYE